MQGLRVARDLPSLRLFRAMHYFCMRRRTWCCRNPWLLWPACSSLSHPQDHSLKHRRHRNFLLTLVLIFYGFLFLNQDLLNFLLHVWSIKEVSQEFDLSQNSAYVFFWTYCWTSAIDKSSHSSSKSDFANLIGKVQFQITKKHLGGIVRPWV